MQSLEESGPIRVLVTDARERSVLAAIRSLDAAGYHVGTAADTRLSPGGVSRSCRAYHRIPSPDTNAVAFVQRLKELADGERYDLLLLGTDASLLAVSENRAILGDRIRVGLPAREVVRRALDKLELTRVAGATGLAGGPTIACENDAEARAAAAELGFPVVAKSVSAVVVNDGRATRPDTRLIRDDGSLAIWLARERPGKTLIQAPQPGPVYSCAGVLTEEGLLGFACACYRRTWPPEAGNASFAQTISPSEDLRERITTLLREIGWQGLFEVELLGRQDGGFMAIDLNPRLYGSIALAARAGAALPVIWCGALLGRAVTPQMARPGVGYRWEEGELRNLAALIRSGSVRSALSLLRPHRPCAHADFNPSDPAPLAARGLLVAARALRSRRRSAREATKVRAQNRAATAVSALAASSASRQGGAAWTSLPVAIIGAGPYGLAVGAHLRDAGVPVRQFGRTMSYWREQMPAGMLLRSSLQSSSICDPTRALRLEHYGAEIGQPISRPIELSQFIEYGEWFKRKTAPELDERTVARVHSEPVGFILTLDDGEEVRASRVIVAAGLFPFGRRPSLFDSLPSARVSHTSEHVDLGAFRGMSVAVIGSGQSALESAALLSEQGAEVEIIARAAAINWLSFSANGAVARRLRWPKPPTDVGGRVTGWIAAAPGGFRMIPSERAREVVTFRCLRPAGAGWLPERLTEATFTLGRSVVAAENAGGGVVLTLDDGARRSVEHVVLGTGYEVDTRRYPFLSAELIDQLETREGMPILRPGLESSIRGLHFVGAPASASFGPIMRFVIGTWYAAPALTRRVLGRRQHLLSLSY
jgi:predicted ATP-grasp superfamily ATP-dependent carboligase/thioredoxin reductase